jgi:hypothetical protein
MDSKNIEDYAYLNQDQEHISFLFKLYILEQSHKFLMDF